VRVFVTGGTGHSGSYIVPIWTTAIASRRLTAWTRIAAKAGAAELAVGHAQRR
jgi:thioester reductase-like protein